MNRTKEVNKRNECDGFNEWNWSVYEILEADWMKLLSNSDEWHNTRFTFPPVNGSFLWRKDPFYLIMDTENLFQDYFLVMIHQMFLF